MTIELKIPMHGGFLKSLSHGILFVNIDGKIITGNQLAYNLLEIGDSHLLSNELMITDYLDFSLLKGKEQTHLEVELINKLVDINSIKVNESIYCISINHVLSAEITDKAMHYIKQLAPRISEGIIIYKEDKVYDCDIELATLFGYTPEEIISMKMSEFIGENPLSDSFQCFVNYNDIDNRVYGIKKNGKKFSIEIIDHPYRETDDEMRIAIIKDISERIEHEKKLSQLANFDELTGLPNLNCFLKVLENTISQSLLKDEKLVVYFIRFGYFKEINETFGYVFGNKLIKAYAEKLKAFDDNETLIARINGDDFIILQRLSNYDDDFTIMPEAIISEFIVPISIDNHDVYTTVSIGISSYPTNGSEANRLVKLAESAMYSIKEKYRSNYQQFELSISQNSQKILGMETDLREALKNEQFSLHYQPQKDLCSKKVIGMEALIRWEHPIKGNIPPMEFIPFAEKTGLIIEIGDWVLQESCRQNKMWQDKGYDPIVVSVNLSAKQFRDNDLVEKVKKTLSETKLEACFLELEITESMAMTNEQTIIKTLHKLRNLGVLISIDDFGTGYSSLKYLSIFPVTKLKIDKVFMDESQKQNRSIVKSIINMSHSLDMKVIAEGVETRDQLNFLVKERCDEMQGYYFSKPLPAHELEVFLKKYS